MNSYCNNCGKNGHAFHQCKSPITSYGIVSFRENPTNGLREYLLIRRKDTLGFVDFMRGKYSIYNKEYILNMINQMTTNERTRLLTDPFSKLWEDLWGTLSQDQMSVGTVRLLAEETTSETQPEKYSTTKIVQDMCSGNDHQIQSNRFACDSSRSFRKNTLDRDPYKAEEQTSKHKLESLKMGVYTKNDYYDLEELIRMTDRKWDEAEWGFPKGRRNYQEKDYDCAVREFCEETGYNINELAPLKNVQPFEEIFTGSNYKSYKHKYYVTYMKYEDTLSSRNLQASEVSESRWMSFKQCDAVIRDYNVEKKRLLAAVERMLNDNCVSFSV